MMNKLILAVGVVLVLSLLSSCAGKETIKEEDMPGGLRDKSWEAPKTIQSKEILRFECELNFNTIQEGGYDFAVFQLVREKDHASYQMSAYGNGIEPIGLQLDLPLATLDDLQTLVDQYDLPRYNGIDRQVNGLPEGLGSLLLIKYASGERVYAHDKSSGFMDYRAVNAIHDFFLELASLSEDPASP